MRILMLIVCIFVCKSEIYSQDNCRRSCMIDPIYGKKVIKHYIFNGEDTTGLNVKITRITVSDARRELVKRRDPNCLSPNPVDCIKEAWEVIPPVTMNLYTLPDPSLTDQYDIREETTTVMVKEGKLVEEPIICPNLRTKRLISAVQEALKNKGYPLEVTGNYDTATSLAVIDFQKNVALPYGDLTLATLAALGVK